MVYCALFPRGDEALEFLEPVLNENQGCLWLCLWLQNREMGMFEIAEWMVEKGTSTAIEKARSGPEPKRQPGQHHNPACLKTVNRAIEIDLRPYLRSSLRKRLRLRAHGGIEKAKYV